jgi:TRAP-type C4-dicarboxylate transport system permease small subunit
MRAISRVLDKILAVSSITLFAVLVVVVVWQVFSRQVLQDPSTWSEEAARYIFVWLGLFGSALVFSERGHIAVDFLIRKLPPSALRVALVFVQLTIIALAVVVFIIGGARYVEQSMGQALSALPFQVGQMFIVMPITGVLITWYAFTHLVEALRATSPYALLPSDEEPGTRNLDALADAATAGDLGEVEHGHGTGRGSMRAGDVHDESPADDDDPGRARTEKEQ